jgi:hypothetical protein
MTIMARNLLKNYLLEVGLRSRLLDKLACGTGTSEVDEADVHMRGKGGTGRYTKAGKNIHHSWWKTSLMNQTR